MWLKESISVRHYGSRVLVTNYKPTQLNDKIIVSCQWVKMNKTEEVVLTFWVFLKSWVQWPVRCTSCRAAQTPRNHRSGRCWGAEAPSASRPPPWSVAALPWSVCGPEVRDKKQVKCHVCELAPLQNLRHMILFPRTSATCQPTAMMALTPAATRWYWQHTVSSNAETTP